MTDIELMQQALDALEQVAEYFSDDSTEAKTITALRERLAQPEQEPVAWAPIEQPYPLAGKLDILLGDGSILCGVIPQEEGDLWWSGTAEKFIDPQYYDITHWRIHCDTAAIRARGQDPMPLFDDWGGIPYKSCPPCNQQCNQGRDCPNA